ncbi:MAG: RagB/SusD family nutrient uptake outer membrane protein [Bacteroidota bacterium]|nr:RagB/SusD family nutrient uptake outer membrane protein [Bacteroidota bacterium]
MKKYFSKILMSSALIVSFFGFNSCTDYLDKSPLSDISPTDAYKNFTNFQGFTEELYNCIPLVTAIGSHNNWNFGEEELWELGESRLFAYNVDQGDYRAWNNAIFGSWFKNGGVPSSNTRGDKGNLWGLSWYGIRKANIGIANLDKLTEASDVEKNLIAGQLYFFRGWFHFMLMQYWGGLPYVNSVLPSDQAPQLPRLSYQALADSVAKDFQKAADLLPVDWDKIDWPQTTVKQNLTPGNNNLRINKIMALAYLGKNLLWAGSPLMNSASTGKQTYDIDYCKKATNAFAQALQLCESTKRYGLVPFSNYSDLFYTYNQGGKLPGTATVNGEVVREAIFMENTAEVAGRFQWNQTNDYRPASINNSGIKCSPTANYIDYYGMANGMPIKDPTVKDPESGYDPEYPWKNRDPRFYTDIMFDGAKCALNSKLAENVQYAALYSGGAYRTGGTTGAKGMTTGYILTKFLPRLMNDWDGYVKGTTMSLSFMRLADVYLMYAEAAAVAYGGSQGKDPNYYLTAQKAVNVIRDRAGVGQVAQKFVDDPDLFMGELRRERAVELAFEGHRFVDLRRWLLLDKRPYTLKKGIEFDRANDVPSSVLYQNPQNGHVKNFRETVIIERQFGPRNYWFPFLTSDVNLYKGFSQNPGW